MWKASAGHAVSITQDDGGADDWETDPDFVNDVSEKEQRWGAKTVQGSGHQEHINIHKLRENVFQEHQTLKRCASGLSWAWPATWEAWDGGLGPAHDP
ncbi:cortactin, isoform CRA_d [Mus musculus]|nr:cortactin, isoform CRA_d [Mus musculus]